MDRVPGDDVGEILVQGVEDGVGGRALEANDEQITDEAAGVEVAVEAGDPFHSLGGAVGAPSAVAGASLTVAAVLADERLLRAGGAAPADMIRNGVLPFLATVAIAAGWHLGMRRLLGANRDEAVQGLFTLLLAGFVTLTMIGVWFRGPGMQLHWAG